MSLEQRGLPTAVTNEDDINTLVNAFDDVVRDLNLWQYYVLDVAREKESVKSAISSGTITPWEGSNVVGKSVAELADLLRAANKVSGLGEFASRFGVRVDPGLAAGLVKTAFEHLSKPVELSEAWGRIVDVLNVSLYQEWEEDTKIAIDSIRNRVRYTRLELKQGSITKE